jgi:hypothetical protein
MLLDLRLTPFSRIHTTIARMVLIDSTLSHWSDKNRQGCLFYQIMYLLKNSMPNSTGIDENGRPLGSKKVFQNNIHDIIFFLRVICGVTQVNRRLQPVALDLLLYHVGWKGDVYWFTLNPALLQSIIDKRSGIAGVSELGHVAGNILIHIGKHIEVPISKCMMEEHAIALRKCRGRADNVDNRNKLRVGARDGIDCGKLSDSKSRDDS